VLLLADDDGLLARVAGVLGEGFSVVMASTLDAVADYSLVILDWRHPQARILLRQLDQTASIVIGRQLGIEESVLAMDLGARDAFDTADLPKLRAAALRELEVARAAFEARQQARITGVLHAAARAASGQLELAALVPLLSRTAAELFGEGVGAVLGLAADDGRLTALVSDGAGSVRPAFETRMQEGVMAAAFRETRTVVANDYARWPGSVPRFRDEVKAAVAAPLLVDWRPIGVLCILTSRAFEFTDEDARVAALLADQLAPALEAARSREIAARREAKQALIAGIGRAAVAGADDAELAGVALPDLARLLQADTAAILLEAGGGLRLAQGTGRLEELAEPIDPGLLASAPPGVALALPDLDRAAAGWGARCVSIRIVHLGAPAALTVCRRGAPFGASELHFLGAIGSILTEASRARSAEQERRNSERRYKALVESAEEGIWQGDAEGRTLYANPALARLLKRPPDALDGKALAGYFTPASRRRFRRQYAACLQGRSGRSNLMLGAGDAAPVEVSVALSPVRHAAGEVRSVLLLVSDLSDRRAAERAASESEAKSRFLATMSHELRTPLNSVLGFAQLLGDDRFGALSERQQRYVGHIVNQAEQLRELITDVLDLSKVSAGQMEFTEETVDLAEAGREVAERLLPLAEAKGQELVVEAAAPVLARADRLRLMQCVINLLANAIKFSPEGSRVRVRAQEGAAGPALAVIDNGPGIAEADHERVFEEFTKLSRGKRGEGTGLGLALTRRLVEGMDGRVTLLSELGQGATFTILLPAAPAADFQI
jgi:PAS domain S-box-containing protein